MYLLWSVVPYLLECKMSFSLNLVLKYVSVHDHPFVPRFPWCAQYSRWNVLWDMDGAHRIGYSVHYFLIYLFIYVFIGTWVATSTPIYLFMYLLVSELKHLLLSRESNTNYILTKEKYNCHFLPEPLTFCFRWPHSTPLSYLTASISMPVPFSAANRLSRSKLSLSNSFLHGSWLWNLKLMVPNCL